MDPFLETEEKCLKQHFLQIYIQQDRGSFGASLPRVGRPEVTCTDDVADDGSESTERFGPEPAVYHVRWTGGSGSFQTGATYTASGGSTLFNYNLRSQKTALFVLFGVRHL